MTISHFKMRNLIIVLSVLINWKVNAFSIGEHQSKPALSKGPIENYIFNQTLDHFDSGNDDLWEQRYVSNKEFFTSKDDAPIFLRVQGESPLYPPNVLGGAWNEWAGQYGAMLYYLEHRYFGESYPTEDMSTDNLKYLTVDQALADIANFIEQKNKENGYTEKNKWILFGGSYSGDLVAWARLKYPNLITGSVSSSAPLQAQVDMSEYNGAVLDRLNFYSPGCGDAFREAYTKLTQIIESGSDSDINNMKDEFSVCDSFDSSKMQDRVLFYKAASTDITGLVQFNGNPLMPHNISSECNNYFLNTDIGDPLKRLITRYQANTNFKQKGSCNDVSYDKYVKAVQDISYSSKINGKRQWFYLLCNELGFSQTSSTKESLFAGGLPLKFYTEQCKDIFGDEFGEERMTKGVEETNKKYQGKDIKVTNVAFVQGSIDPWHVQGMITNPTEDAPQIFIDGPATYHGADMDGHYTDKLADYMVKALQEINDNLKKWLS